MKTINSQKAEKPRIKQQKKSGRNLSKMAATSLKMDAISVELN